MFHLTARLALLCLVLVFVHSEVINKDIILKKVERKIDIASQLVKISAKVLIENLGSNSLKSFLYSFSEESGKNVAFFSATVGSTMLTTSQVKVPEMPQFTYYKVDLKDTLQPGKSVSVDVEYVLTGILLPYPKSVQQGEKQLIEYSGNHYLLSPYPVLSQTTTVLLLSPNVISYSRLKPTSHSDTSITYGPYENIQPFSEDTMKVHYENNSPFLTISRLERIIELSHWGNLAIEETVDVVHTGAKLKGSFSRYDYQREHNTYSSVKSFKTILPASAKDVYYRDDIGNISTSHMRIMEDAVELDLRPRFPLFGGWKTHYTIGYNVPSYEYLYHKGDQFVLKMRYVDHIFDDMWVEEILLKIILPEGVRDVDFRPPYEVTRHPNELHYTYLDVLGRTVLVSSKRNLVENHIIDFEVHYRFQRVLMLLEPILLIVAFFLLFSVVIIYTRLDMTLSKDDQMEAKMRISSHCEMVHSHHDKRAAFYEKLEEEIQKLKTSKDVTHAQVTTKKLFNSIKEETQAISEIISKVKVDSTDYADKIAELQKHDKVVQDCLTQQVSAAEKLVTGKMNKQSYMETDTITNKKKEAALEKVRAALASI